MAVAAPARKATPARAPARRATPRPLRARTAAPARAPQRQPQRSRPRPKKTAGGQLIPLAVGTATAVGHLPDSGLVVRMTRGRAWIGVLGALLAGIVALNVVTLSLAASTGRIDRDIQALDQDNSITQNRAAKVLSTARVRHAAAGLGLSTPTTDQVTYLQASPQNIAAAAQRLAAAGSG
jgi:hypothetical protein